MAIAEQRDFIVSSADAYGYDPETGNLLFVAQSLMTSTFTINMDELPVRGGRNNPLLYQYYHSRNVTVELTSATFKQEFMAENVGQTVNSRTIKALQPPECFTLNASGVGTLSRTPSSGEDVTLYNTSTGAYQRVTPSGTSVTYLPWANVAVEAIYVSDQIADVTDIHVSDLPNIIELIMIADQVNPKSGGINARVQIRVPRFQVSGNYGLEFTSDAVLDNMLTGTALASQVDCGEPRYAEVAVIPVSGAGFPITSIFATFDENGEDFLTVPVPTGQDATYPITTLGVRGLSFGQQDVTSTATYSIVSGGDPDITVDSGTGIVTVATTATTGDRADIQVSYSAVQAGVANTFLTVVIS